MENKKKSPNPVWDVEETQAMCIQLPSPKEYVKKRIKLSIGEKTSKPWPRMVEENQWVVSLQKTS